MHYDQQEFFRLMEEVEFQGGEYLDELHDGIFHTKLTGDKVRGYEVAYCGEAALFEVPYEPMNKQGVIAKVKVCAVDDRMGLWPRFAGANAPGIT